MLCQQQYLWALLYKSAPRTAPAQHPPRGAPAPSDTRRSRRNGRPHPAAPGRAQEGTTDAIPRRGLPAWQGMLPLEHHAVKKYQLKKWQIALGGAVLERTHGAKVSPRAPASRASWSGATGSIPGEREGWGEGCRIPPLPCCAWKGRYQGCRDPLPQQKRPTVTDSS